MEKAEYRRMYEAEERFWWYVAMRHITAGLLDPLYLPQTTRSRLKILDAGCGTGGNMRFLQRYGQVYGVDASEDALAFCRERKLANVQLGRVEALPFGDASFDLVTSFDVLYHSWIDDDLAVLREFARVLRPGGRLFVRVPAYDWLRGEHDLVVSARHRYTAGEIGQKLRQANLRVERASYVNMLLFAPAAAKRAFEMLRMRTKHDGQRAHSDLAPLPRPLNRLLTAILSSEAVLLRHIDLPFGLSVIALASK